MLRQHRDRKAIICYRPSSSLTTPPYLLTYKQAGSTFGSTLLGLLGIVVPDGNVLIGVECFPIAGPVGVDPGTSSCSANTLCCSNISFVWNCLLFAVFCKQ